MITVKEAAKIALQPSSEGHIVGIRDVGTYWTFDIVGPNGECYETGCIPAVNKDGTHKICFPPICPELKDAKKIPLSVLD